MVTEKILERAKQHQKRNYFVRDIFISREEVDNLRHVSLPSGVHLDIKKLKQGFVARFSGETEKVIMVVKTLFDD
ncbi:MAG: hypothetical protein APG12_00871 [Candidatus Methanofastidiosum methylothiophilum]|uniref:Uncharacterized protein n=1 Tax=Candidatus Methanofastidiosum methylothiophilum TaxID=1705564 RepID=A0A150IQC5_9EURY|nr:MAG: hypothetical protein APG10_01076 [Candidatus Methanofastidiosum methylthiophilus]KYC47249.1 MAG: hypothetical protein APG11_01292 [Candidatus Methanofastidiosum methylthiophilus]KYC50343.1 MAG: hypothetical protein APG12_00871 [Candidatus Methanofastidiosum methylthiophilus]